MEFCTNGVQTVGVHCCHHHPAMRSRWLSPPIMEINCRKVFNSCQTTSGDRISTGDFVHLLPSDPCTQLYVGRIESIHEDKDGLNFVLVRWLYQPKDLQHNPPSEPLPGELFYTSYYDYQLVESIIGRCKVIHKKDYLQLKSRNEGMHASLDVYGCGYSYSAETGVFLAIHEEELAGHETSLPYPGTHGNGIVELSVEDMVVAKHLANALLNIDRSVPHVVARADWSTKKRLPWVLKAKNAITLDDVKWLLIDLETGLGIFQHESGWQESVQASNSFYTLRHHIRCLKDEAQQKVDEACKKSSSHAKRTMETDWRTRKRKISLVAESKQVKQQGICNEPLGKIHSAYEIDQTHLPPKAPIDLKCLRVVMVAHTTEDSTIIMFPTIASLTKYFQSRLDNGCSNRTLQRLKTAAGEPPSFFRARPVLDGQYALPNSSMARVLKRLVPSAEYLNQGHLETFWIGSSVYALGHESSSKDADPAMAMQSPSTTPLTKVEEHRGVVCCTRKKSRRGILREPLTHTHDEERHGCKGGVPKDKFESPTDDCTGAQEAHEDAKLKSQHGRNISVRWGARKRIIYKTRSWTSSLSGTDSAEKNHISEDLDSRGAARIWKTMQGRWSSERYKAARLKLLAIMHEKGAGPAKPIPRPALREEGRRQIGDTGLLDHLLKHMAGSVVNGGQCFRRRHNAEGVMEYWLEDASQTDLRNQAGSNNPWVALPCWKPGEQITPKSPFYGLVAHTPPLQVDELKDDILKLRSQMESISIHKKGSSLDSREGAPHIADEKVRTWEQFTNGIKDHAQELKQEIQQLMEALKDNSSLQDEDLLPTRKIERTHSNIDDHLERINHDILKFSEDATYSYRYLATEKHLVEQQVDDLWKSVEVMQEDVNVVLNSMGFSQPVAVLPSCEPPTSILLALTDRVMLDSQQDDKSERDAQCPGNENILLFQRAAQASSLQSQGNQLQLTVHERCVSPALAEKQTISAMEEHKGSGFRLWKAEATTRSPGVGRPISSTSSTIEKVEEPPSGLQASESDAAQIPHITTRSRAPNGHATLITTTSPS